MEWVQSLSEAIKGQVIAIHGKTARRTRDRVTAKAALHVVSAWPKNNELVLGQINVDDKSKEITPIPELLKMLDINGRIITTDATDTQKDIAKDIIEDGGDYVLSLWKNYFKIK